jgi:hypothetical protein
MDTMQDTLNLEPQESHREKVIAFPGGGPPVADVVEVKKSKLRLAIEAAAARAAVHQITDQASLDAAETMCRDLGSFAKEVCELLDPLIALQFQAHKASTTARAQLVKPAETARNGLKARMELWLQNQRLQARARELEAQQTAAREQAELAASHRGHTFLLTCRQCGRSEDAIAAYLRAANWPSPKHIPEMRFQEAMTWANNIPPRPVVTQSPGFAPVPYIAPPPVYVAPPPPAAMPVMTSPARLSGGSHEKWIWTYEVTNLMETVQAVARGALPLDVLMINDDFVCPKVTALKGALRYPGIRVFEKARITVR